MDSRFVWQPISRERYFTDAEMVTLFEVVNELERQPRWVDPCFLVRFVFGTGLRVGEIPPLRIGADISPDGVLLVRRSKSGRQRQVAMSPELYPFFKLREMSYLRASPARKKLLAESGLLFPRRNGGGEDLWGYDENRLMKPLNKRTLQMYWTRVIAEADVRQLSIHCGRHTYATMELASRRLTFKEVQSQLGHGAEETTREVYQHVVVEGLYNPTWKPLWWEIALKKINEIKRVEEVEFTCA